MTRAAINNSLWTFSLVLQLGLLALVFARGLARRMPLFTALLAFYPLRAVLVFVLASRLAADDYADLYRWLALTALTLLLMVEGSLALRAGGWQAFAAIAVAAWGGALLIAHSLPSRTPLPVDRLEIFVSLLGMLLAVLVLLRPLPRPATWVALGLGTFGGVDVAATLGKTLAATHHNVARFTAWSYVASLGYVLVVLLWMIALQPGPTAENIIRQDNY